MPLVFVHGVANRMDDRGNLESFQNTVEPLLRRYVAPVISADTSKAVIELAYWGGSGVKFAWNGTSRPPSALLGMGAQGMADVAERAAALSSLPESRKQLQVSAPETSGPTPRGLIEGGAVQRPLRPA